MIPFKDAEGNVIGEVFVDADDIDHWDLVISCNQERFYVQLDHTVRKEFLDYLVKKLKGGSLGIS